jgi:hypothetical protein
VAPADSSRTTPDDAGVAVLRGGTVPAVCVGGLGVAVSAGWGWTGAAGFAAGTVLARAFGAADFGTYAFVLTYVSYFGIAADAGLGRLLIRDVARDRAAALEYLGHVTALRLALAALDDNPASARSLLEGATRELAQALEARGIRYLVVEYNPEIAGDLRQRGVPVIYGDAANPAVLEHAHLDRARLLAILMPDVTAAELATRHARAMNSRLDILARGGGVGDLDRLRAAGATEVVQPEFEAGQEVIRHALRRFGLGGLELSNLITGRRAAYYRRMAEEERA